MKAHAGSGPITTASNSFSGIGVGIAVGLNTTIIGTVKRNAMTVVTKTGMTAATGTGMTDVTTASQNRWCRSSSRI
jgi:hypothetical protein